MAQKDKFKIIQRTKANVDCLYLHGYLDAHTAPELESTISGLISKGRHNILIVLRDLEYISSAGLGVFMEFIEEIRNKGGDIKIADLKPKVFSVFELLGFPLLFDIEREEEKALLKFNAVAE